MRWQNRRESSNVEDRRSQSSGGLGGGIPIGGKSRIVLLIVVLVAGYYGVDLTGLVDTDSSNYSPQTSSVSSEQEQEAAQFTSVILATTEDFWSAEFKQLGKTYTPPKLVLYKGATQTGCGTGQSVMGPFYCPADQTVYLDLSFYQEMQQRLGGGGDFAQGYVIAHEIGHHVQNLLGTFNYVEKMRQGQSKTVANQPSVKLELQADCYAGVWGKAMEKLDILEVGDLEKALNTAEAIGDDRLQKQSQGYVVPDSFTHGSSAERYKWFKRGFDSSNINQCNTFTKN